MKKHLIILMALLALGSVQQVHAQGWLKALGQIAKDVLGSDEQTESNSSSSSSSSTSSSTYKIGLGSTFNADGINIKFTGCEHYGEFVYLYFTATNTRSSENMLRLYRNDALNKHQEAIGPDGNSYDTDFILGGNSYENRLKLPSGIPIKGVFAIKEYDKSLSSIKTFKFQVGTNEHSNINEFFHFELRNIPIIAAQNTNLSNITCSHPRIFVQYNSCTRTGTSVVISLTLKNQASQAIKCNISYDNRTAYDDNGDNYTPKVTLSSSTGVLQPGIPVKTTITIPNVPRNITNMSYVKVPFYDGDSQKFSIEMRGISFK